MYLVAVLPSHKMGRENQNFSRCSSSFIPSAANISNAASTNNKITTFFKLQISPLVSGNFKT
jgi:hypothetical protein